MSDQATSCEACGCTMHPWILDKSNTLLQCPECRHISRDLRMCNADARSHAWGGVSSFDRIRNSLTFKSMSQTISCDVHATSANRVLEIGFGSGFMLKKWIRQGWRTYGIEASSLEIPIEEEVKEQSVLRFGKVEEVDFQNDTFDLIYGIHLIEHLDDPARVFEQLYRILNPGGMLYFMTPNADSLGLRWFKANWWNLEDPTHVRFFSPDSITHMLKEIGFSEVKIHIPRWDSIMVEANSVFRYLTKNPSKHGIFDKKWLHLPVMMLAVPFLFLRLIIPNVSSSIEIIAKKSSTPTKDKRADEVNSA